MPSKSKTKGKTFEREIANFLSKIYSSSFTRVPDSGAFTGGKNAFRREKLTEGQVRAHKGDIIPPDDWKFFNVECKNYADFPFHNLISTGPIPILEDWIKQTLQAADPGDCNTLIFRITRKGTFIATQLPNKFTTTRHIDYTDKANNVWRIANFNEFFENNTTTFADSCKSI
jgi:hypothetical protein